MNKIILILLTLTFVGCASGNWVRSDSSSYDVAREKSDCDAESERTVPTTNTKTVARQGYRNPVNTNCIGSNGNYNCTSTGGDYVPEESYEQQSVGSILGQADASWKCMERKGFRYQRNN